MAGAAPPSHHKIGGGAYGCVFPEAWPCAVGTEKDLNSSGVSLSERTVHKIQRSMSQSNVENITAILTEVDPAHIVTVPLESMCFLTPAAKAGISETDCAPVHKAMQKNPVAPITQLKMRRGTPLREHIKNVVSKDGVPALPVIYDQLLQFMRDMYSKFYKNHIAHGDLKVDNLVVMADGKIRMVDFDLLFRYDLQFTEPGISVVPFKKKLAEMSNADIYKTFENACKNDRAAVLTISVHFPPDNLCLQPETLKEIEQLNSIQKKHAESMRLLRPYDAFKKKKEEGGGDMYSACIHLWRINANMTKLRTFIKTAQSKDPAADYIDTPAYHENPNNVTLRCIMNTLADSDPIKQKYTSNPNSVSIDDVLHLLPLSHPLQMLQNYDPEKFAAYQIGFVLFDYSIILQDVLKSLEGKILNIPDRLRALTTDLLMPMSEDRLGLEGAIDTLEGIVADMRRNTIHPDQLFLYRTNFFEMRSTRLFRSIEGNYCTCRDYSGYFADQLMDNPVVLNDPEAEFWMVHDDAAWSTSQPSIGHAVSIAVTRPQPPDTMYIEYLCNSNRMINGAGKLLYTFILKQAKNDGFKVLGLQAASEHLWVKTYPGYGMKCENKATKRGGKYYICTRILSETDDDPINVSMNAQNSIVKGSDHRFVPAVTHTMQIKPEPTEISAEEPSRAHRRERQSGPPSKKPAKIVDLVSDNEDDDLSPGTAAAARSRRSGDIAAAAPSPSPRSRDTVVPSPFRLRTPSYPPPPPPPPPAPLLFPTAGSTPASAPAPRHRPPAPLSIAGSMSFPTAGSTPASAPAPRHRSTAPLSTAGSMSFPTAGSTPASTLRLRPHAPPSASHTYPPNLTARPAPVDPFAPLFGPATMYIPTAGVAAPPRPVPAPGHAVAPGSAQKRRRVDIAQQVVQPLAISISSSSSSESSGSSGSAQRRRGDVVDLQSSSAAESLETESD